MKKDHITFIKYVGYQRDKPFIDLETGPVTVVPMIGDRVVIEDEKGCIRHCRVSRMIRFVGKKATEVQVHLYEIDPRLVED